MSLMQVNRTKYADYFLTRATEEYGTVILAHIQDTITVRSIVNTLKAEKFIIMDDRAPCTWAKKMGYETYIINNDEEYVTAMSKQTEPIDLVLMNPPFKYGGKVWDNARRVAKEVICLMPLSQYKQNSRYRYIKTLEKADGSIFKNAIIGENLAITTTQKVDNSWSKEEFMLQQFNPLFHDFYKWNIKHNRGLFMNFSQHSKAEDFDRTLDFLDSSRVSSYSHGQVPSYLKSGFGYTWNMTNEDVETASHVGCIHFESKTARDNFCKYAYNYETLEERKDHLAHYALAGINCTEVTKDYYMSIPQIDWALISNNSLWQKGLYDEAVLEEMNLEWKDPMDKKKGVKTRA